MIQITSPSNPRISRLRELHTTRGRKKSGLFLMEGPHLLQTLLEASLLPQEVYYQPELLRRSDEGKELLIRLRELIPEQMIEVSERVIEALGEAQTSQGVVSVLPYALFEPNKLRRNRPAAKRSCLLVLDDLADPGNMGTILRTALAADVESILLTPHCVDSFSPKVVRSAAGAHVALPIESDMSWEQIEARIEKHCGPYNRIFIAEAGDSGYYYQQNLSDPFALIIGNEAHGLSNGARALATGTLSIPLFNQVESLNAAMATGIILYESVRQRQQPGR